MSQHADITSLTTQSFIPPATGKPWQFLIVDEGEELPANRWYQRRCTDAPNRVKYAGRWSTNWTTFTGEETVADASDRNREMCFFLFSARPDFRISLEREPDNPPDASAIRVMGSAIFHGKRADVRLGYLSRETAKALGGQAEIDARPYCVYLPRDGEPFGLGIRVLVRSPAYLKKVGRPSPHFKKQRPASGTRNIREDVFQAVYSRFDAAREEYHCQKVSQPQFRRVFDPYFGDALEELALTEQELNDPGSDADVDLAGVMIKDMLPCIVETLLEEHPQLHIKR